MFRAKINNLEKFKEIFCILSKLVPEARLTINKDMIYLISITEGFLGEIEIIMKNTMFNGYSVDDEMNVGIKPDVFYKCVKNIDSEDVDIVVDKNYVELRSIKNNVETKYSITQIDFEDINVGEPIESLKDFTFIFNVDSSSIKKVITDLDSLDASNVKFSWDNSGLKIGTEHEILVNFSVWFSKDAVKFEKIQGVGSATFNINLLKPFFSSLLTEKSFVYIGDNYPMKIVCDDEKFKVSYVIAPLIIEG